jgi:hypothetical protein
VPDDLLGKSVKCPGCHEPFTADGGGAVTLALPPRETAEDERVTPEPGLGGDEKPEPKRPIPSANWRRVRRGFTFLLASALAYVGAILLYVGSGACMSAVLFAAPRMERTETMMMGVYVLVAMCLLGLLTGCVLGIIGLSLSLAAPWTHGAKTLARATLALVLVGLLLTLTSFVVNAATGGFMYVDDTPVQPDWLRSIGHLVGLVVLGLTFIALFTFGFYVRAIAFSVGARSLARSAKGWIILLGIVAILAVLATGAIVLFQDQLAGGGGSTAVAGSGGSTTVATWSGPAGLLLGCGFGIVALVLAIWYVILLAQARTAISSHVSLRS